MGLFAEGDFPTLLVLGILAMTIGFLLWRSHRYLARQGKGSSPLVHTARPTPSRQGLALDAPDDVARWEVEMHDTARELCGQLDSKMGALEHLIREADRAAARLEAALEAAPQPAGQARSGKRATKRASRSFGEPDPLQAQPGNQAEALKSAGAGDHDAASRHVPQGEGRERPSAEHRYEEIYLLSDYGFDTTEIARRVGSPVGEVELILGLRRQR